MLLGNSLQASYIKNCNYIIKFGSGPDIYLKKWGVSNKRTHKHYKHTMSQLFFLFWVVLLFVPSYLIKSPPQTHVFIYFCLNWRGGYLQTWLSHDTNYITSAFNLREQIDWISAIFSSLMKTHSNHQLCTFFSPCQHHTTCCWLDFKIIWKQFCRL